MIAPRKHTIRAFWRWTALTQKKKRNSLASIPLYLDRIGERLEVATLRPPPLYSTTLLDHKHAHSYLPTLSDTGRGSRH